LALINSSGRLHPFDSANHNPDKPEPNREKLVGIRILRIARIKKSNGLNPGDSANPDTTESFCFFCKDITCNRPNADEPQPYGRSQKEFIAHGSVPQGGITEMKSFFRGSSISVGESFCFFCKDCTCNRLIPATFNSTTKIKSACLKHPTQLPGLRKFLSRLKKSLLPNRPQ
jgi:hypothetical protein